MNILIKRVIYTSLQLVGGLGTAAVVRLDDDRVADFLNKGAGFTLEKVISHIPSGLFVPHGSHKNHLFPHWLLLSVVQKGAVI